MQSERIKTRIGSLEMKKLVAASVCGLCVWFGSVSVSHAGVIDLDTFATVDDLFLTGTVLPVGDDVNYWEKVIQKLDVGVYSQAYTNGTEYAYLYQVDNKGSGASSDPVELFTLSPFYGADDSVKMGYLTDAVAPTGFLSEPYDNPELKAYVNLSGPIISFYYTSREGYQIVNGKHSAVMYVLSNLSPDLIWGNVINGLTASDEVVGPLPEPGTIALISVGGLAILLRRRRRQGV